MASLIIRPYQPSDRKAVRAICCDTGNLGDPVDMMFPDRDIFADLISRYYTDYEPESVWVAESGGAVGGYLTGCLDSRRYQRVMRWRVVPHVLLHGIWKGLLVERATWRLAGGAMRTLQFGGWDEPAAMRRYPAHLHLNLRPHLRGRRVGAELVERFLAHAKAHGVTGTCAAVRGDNAAACRFFQRLGFKEIYRHPIAWPVGLREYSRQDRVVYAKTL